MRSSRAAKAKAFTATADGPTAAAAAGLSSGRQTVKYAAQNHNNHNNYNNNNNNKLNNNNKINKNKNKINNTTLSHEAAREAWPTPPALERVLALNQRAMALLRDNDNNNDNDMSAIGEKTAQFSAETERNGGAGRESEAVLREALAIAEREIHIHETDKNNTTHNNKNNNKNNNKTNKQKELEAWQLCYAMTLSNLGCVLLRCGLDDEEEGGGGEEVDEEENNKNKNKNNKNNKKEGAALRCLRAARDLEARVAGGKPSCSTMLNLSAALLRRGEAAAALPIAKDCVAAAAHGDPLLFLTALHNLAVALGQQPDRRARSAALPTMLRARREAQDLLGDQHPTTRRLADRCAATHHWILSDRPTEPPPLPPLSSVPPFPPTTTTTAERMPRETPEPVKDAASSGKRPPVHLSPLESQHQRPALADRTPPPQQQQQQQQQQQPLHQQQQQRDRERIKTDAESIPSAAAVVASTATVWHFPQGERGVVQPPPAAERRQVERLSANETVSQATSHAPQSSPVILRENGTPSVEKIARSSVELEGSHAAYCTSSLSTVLEARLEESGNHSNGNDAAVMVVAASTPFATGPAAPTSQERRLEPKSSTWSTGYHVNIYAHENQSFLRFAEKSSSPAEDGAETSENLYLTYQRIREKMRRQRAATVGTPVGMAADDSRLCKQADSAGAETHPGGKGAAGETTMTEQADAANKRVLSSRDRLAMARSERAAAERREEEAYRRRKAVVDAAARAEAAFQSALAALVNRTQDRAARAIQAVWSPWWQMIGKPRREAQLRRAEERERRLRDRLAAMSDRGCVDGQQEYRDRLKAAQDGKAGQFAAPGVVVRCAQRWLEQTVAVRYLVRRGLQRGIHEQAGSTDPRYPEEAVQRQVVRIQAIWRGALVRRRHQARASSPTVRARQQQDAAARRAEEERTYAALLIQKLFRCHAARKVRQARYVEAYTPPVLKLQAWFRATLQGQRTRGTDGRTVRHRHSAALIIQCAWRRFQARLRRYVELIKKDIRYLRIQEAEEKRLALERQETALIEARKEAELVVTKAADAAEKANAEAEAMAAEAREAERARGPGFVSAYSGKFYPEIAIQHTAYERECLNRIYDVYASQEAAREAQEVPLYLEPVAERERQAWASAINLRPFIIARRRAAEDLLCEEELYAVRQSRAVVKIQRAFRTWLRHRNNPNRNRALLLISRGKYQQAGLGRQIARKQRRRDQEKWATVYGDHAKDQRDLLQETRRELAEEEAQVTSMICLSQLASSANASPAPLAFANARPQSVSTTPGSGDAGAVCGVRTRQQRWTDEKNLRADERYVASTYPRDLAKLRGDVYYQGYPTPSNLE